MVKNVDTPMAAHTPADRKNKIVHARLEVGGTVLMGGDVPPDYYKPMDGCTVNINAKTPEDAERVFGALS